MKSDKNFRIKQTTKVLLALGKFSSKDANHAFRHAMIDAQLCEDAARKQALKSKNNKTVDIV